MRAIDDDMVTREEIMMNLFENCGMEKLDSVACVLTLKNRENYLKMADFLESKNFKVTTQEVYNAAGKIRDKKM